MKQSFNYQIYLLNGTLFTCETMRKFLFFFFISILKKDYVIIACNLIFFITVYPMPKYQHYIYKILSKNNVCLGNISQAVV